MTRLYIGIGEICGTAFQIRRYTSNEEAYLFDWLVTPNDSFDFIAKPNDDFLVSGNWDIVGLSDNPNIRVRDHFSGLLFQHEFARDAANRIDAARVEEHLPTAREKFVYLKNKTIEAIRNSPDCVLVRAENSLVTLDDAVARLNQIRAAFKPINPNVKIVLASSNFESEHQHPEFITIKLAHCDEWVGDPQSWQRLFLIADQLL